MGWWEAWPRWEGQAGNSESSAWEALRGWGLPGTFAGWDGGQLSGKGLQVEREAPARQRSSGSVEAGARARLCYLLMYSFGQVSSLL